MVNSTMKCDCCRRKKKLLESFAEVKDGKTTLRLCVDCNDLFYKLRDAANEDDSQEFDNVMTELNKKMKKSSVALRDWAAGFTDKQKAKLSSPSDKDDAGKETSAE